MPRQAPAPSRPLAGSPAQVAADPSGCCTTYPSPEQPPQRSYPHPAPSFSWISLVQSWRPSPAESMWGVRVAQISLLSYHSWRLPGFQRLSLPVCALWVAGMGDQSGSWRPGRELGWWPGCSARADPRMGQNSGSQPTVLCSTSRTCRGPSASRAVSPTPWCCSGCGRPGKSGTLEPWPGSPARAHSRQAVGLGAQPRAWGELCPGPRPPMPAASRSLCPLRSRGGANRMTGGCQRVGGTAACGSRS